MTVKNGDYGEFKGTTQQALKEIHEDVRVIREKLDLVCVEHESRVSSLENNAKFMKWIFMAIMALLSYLGLKP